MKKKVIVVGSGNAALCAGIAVLEKGADVLMLEKASPDQSGGNSKYTAGAMRFAYKSADELLPLLLDPNDPRLPNTEFGSYSEEKFEEDLLGFNNGQPLSLQQKVLISRSKETMQWLASHNVKFEPIYSRQSFEKNGKHIFWGGLTLAAKGEGVGLVETELQEFLSMGGKINYGVDAQDLIYKDKVIKGVVAHVEGQQIKYEADAVILACGGFEANADMRRKYIGEQWVHTKVRGTPHNTGSGIEMALTIGAAFEGNPAGCHATPMDANMPDYGNLDIPYIERKQYRKICYFLGIMVNSDGKRFVDEGKNFRNYTYAQFGRAILEQPDRIAWQIFDAKVDELLYSEYKFWDATYISADTIVDLVEQMTDIDKEATLSTIDKYNESVDTKVPFDPTLLDGKSTIGLLPDKTNWANTLDTPPFKAYPVTCGITFTYGGLKADQNGRVINKGGQKIKGLYCCGELVGGVIYNGYPGGSGLTSGAVFGRLAGYSAVEDK